MGIEPSSWPTGMFAVPLPVVTAEGRQRMVAAHAPADDRKASDVTQLQSTVQQQQRQIERLEAQLGRLSAEKGDLLRRARVRQSITSF